MFDELVGSESGVGDIEKHDTKRSKASYLEVACRFDSPPN